MIVDPLTYAPAPIGSEDRYRLLVEAISDYAIYMLDPEGRVVSWNPGAERLKGYKTDEVLGEHFSLFFTPEDQTDGLPERALATALREGRFESEGWRVRKDGARFWALAVLDPIYTQTGSFIGYAKITRDLTERRNAELALARSEQQFRLLVQGVSDYAIYMLDPHGIVTNWNSGAQRIKGYRPDEIIGRHFSTFYSEEDREAGLPGVGLRTARLEGRFEKEGWRHRKDGSRFYAHVVIDAIFDDDGALIGFAKITRDITEKRAAQLALEQARDAFFQSQKMEAIGQLTGGVAHDFNNLLMVILGSLDLLKRRLPPDRRTTPLLENAFEAAQRGASLTQRMLSFARKQELRLTPVDLKTLVQGMAQLINRTLGVHCRIETRFPLNLRSALADAHQLELAVLNLVVNARDAMPNGGDIEISGRDADLGPGNELALAEGPYVRLSVKDHGVGMDEATLARASEPFFTTKGVGKGTGLGLPMVHGTAEQVGGKLVLHSAVGNGTTAEIWLPAAPELSAKAAPQEDGQHEDVRTEPLSILLVDDDLLVLTSTAELIKDLGHEVRVAVSGAEALRVLDEETWLDLVITDVLMPGMTGIELAKAVRSQRPEIAILLASGFAEIPNDMPKQFKRLAKPYRRNELERMLSAVANGLKFGDSETRRRSNDPS
ncbi:PAS domain-containing sensor histidine kinase [Methylopila sp. 73B]|uniref:hybrid sensor histidine kinase/response regulator n=1 Tax=Methylopila sp. 73B TaxID=1120792 RepID=UPI0003A55451|nr:PAS domain-containing sensor histidine kinase [Methylopila sp. 73B]